MGKGLGTLFSTLEKEFVHIIPYSLFPNLYPLKKVLYEIFAKKCRYK